MENQVEKTEKELRTEAEELGVNVRNMKPETLKKAIASKKSEKGPTGISVEEAKKIEARLRYESELAEKFRAERKIKTDRAEIIAKSESLSIPIDLPDNPTELDLAKARRSLNMKEKEVRPSPETVAIEAGKRGYYVFTNREQDDASHTVNPGGKYTIHLIPDQIHVLSEAHIKLIRKTAVTPIYKRIKTGSTEEGQMGERCERTGSKPRFAFEFIGPAPQEAPFGLVTDAKILEGLQVTEGV